MVARPPGGGVDEIRPPRAFTEQANVSDPDIREAFAADWPACWRHAADLLTWYDQYDDVLTDPEPPLAWFAGGSLNASVNCVDRHLESGGKNRVAFRWLGRLGEVETYTYQDLHRAVNQTAAALQGLGVGEGDVVTLYLPVIPELPVAMLACARIGAVHAVVSAGFSADALADRLAATGSSVLVTCDGYYRYGEAVDQQRKAENARLTVDHDVADVVVVERLDSTHSPLGPDDQRYSDLVVAHRGATVDPVPRSSTDPLFTISTSGTSGDPSRVDHVTGGYLAHAAWTSQAVLDLSPGDTLWCTADLGWITGHTYAVYGPLALGATTLLTEGAADRPERNRVYETIDRHAVDVFYTAPTVIRALQKHRAADVDDHDLSSVRLVGSVGEPLTAKTWSWYREHLGNGTAPVVDTWWQTETGGMLIATLPGVDDMKPGFAGSPLPGVRAAVLDVNGDPVAPGEPGYLHVTRPWPGMPVSLASGDDRLNAPARSRADGWAYFTEDRAVVDDEGRIRLLGRLEDSVTVDTESVPAMAFESRVLDLDGVAEAAVVDAAGNGGCVYVFVSVVPDDGVDEATVRDAVRDLVDDVPASVEVVFTPELPRTRSGKIMRRLLRNIVEGEAVADVSALSNPGVVGELRSMLHD